MNNEKITTSMTADKRQKLAISLLERLNKFVEERDIIRDILLLIKEHTSFEAVGIRLKDGGDYPYYETCGFTGDFLKTENSLYVYNKSGELICDSNGNPALECICGTVLCGMTNPSISFFTHGGSFWTNCTSEFKSEAIENNFTIRIRNRCNSEGYESVALIPLKSADGIVGLLQLNDRRKNLFSKELLTFFEGIAWSIGIALRRRIVEKNLIESKNQFHDLYDNAPSAYFSVGTDGNICICNKSAEKLLGYRIEDLIGEPFINLYSDSPYGKEKANKIFNNFQSDQTITDKEMQMQKADGDQLWVSLTINPIINASGQTTEIRSIVIDITERKRAEAILASSLNIFNYSESSSVDEIIQYVLEECVRITESRIGYFHFVNSDQETIRLHTWSKNTMKHCEVKEKDNHYPITKAGVWVDCIRQKRPVIHNDYKNLHNKKGLPKGHVPIFREMAIPILENEQIVAILGVGNKPQTYDEFDIKQLSLLSENIWMIIQRKRAEAATRASEERYALAQRVGSIGSWDLNIVTGKIQWSDTILTMFGFRHGEFGATYETFIDCVHPEDRQFVIDSIIACIESDVDYSIEHRIIWPDEETHWVSEIGTVIRNNEGKAIRMIGVVQDITLRKEIENELIKHQSQLENTVKERTQELKKTNEKLRKEISERIKAEDGRIKAYTELDQIFSTISIGISYIDRDYNFIGFNKKFIDMFHLKKSDCWEKKCFKIWNENICRTTNCPMKKILSGENYIEYEVNKRLPGGEEIRCLVNSIPYISKDGDMIGIIQYYTDVTDRHQIQKEVLDISEKERQRIGSDLHDLIGQNLTATAFLTEALRQKILDMQLPEALKNVDQIDTLITESISQTRKITRMLNPVEMEKWGLKNAIKSMAETTEDIYKISCKVIQKGDNIFNDIHDATHLFYIAREAVNNALKHGKAQNIIISLTSNESSSTLMIRDDGSGITEPKEDPGMGLKIMRYRAKMIGAEFSAINRKDGGFQVIIHLRK